MCGSFLSVIRTTQIVGIDLMTPSRSGPQVQKGKTIDEKAPPMLPDPDVLFPIGIVPSECVV